MGRFQFCGSLCTRSEKRGGRQGGRCKDGILERRCSARCSTGGGSVAMALRFDLPARRGLAFCQSSHREAVLPGELAEVADQAGCEARWGRRGYRVAKVSPQLSFL